MSRVAAALGDVEHVVDGDDADQDAGRVGDWQRRSILPSEHLDRRFLRVGRLQGHIAAIHQVRHVHRQRDDEKFPHADIVDEAACLVDDVDDVQRLAVLSVLPHEVHDLLTDQSSRTAM